MPDRRPSKVLRLNFAKRDPAAFLALFSDPDEVRLGANQKSFIAVRDGVITISPGLPGVINLQGMPGMMRYGGMISDLPFPLALLPKTPVTPLPTHILNPPLKEILPILRDLATASSMFVGL